MCAAAGANLCFEALKRFASNGDVLARRRRAAMRRAGDKCESCTEGGNVVAGEATPMPRRIKRLRRHRAAMRRVGGKCESYTEGGNVVVGEATLMPRRRKRLRRFERQWVMPEV